ncbi:MAG: YeeE/YedE family protein [Acinetobacter sp.]|jgi:uncharacterized membrane protein YedE/YeeE|nr:MAG: YeeE/YedE family protein [Acinetobacter sp.]
MKNFAAFIFGGVFSLGLMLSGMSNPEKVLNFLDIFGTWDASLMFVMGGAVMLAFIPFQKVVRAASPKTLLGELIELPRNTQIDKKLLLGGALFGIGWGIAGICPAPALTLIGLGHYEVFYFIVAMLGGMWIYHKMSGGY